MLRIGKVAYSNTLPLFYSLEGFEVVEGHPTELVKLLREGKIEAGIVSSVEYFFNPELYHVLPGVSISSKGKVCSVLLLSRKPIEEVSKVRITPTSLTSRYLLFYILKEVYRISFTEVSEGEDALLSIGDDALRLRDRFPFVYDLGEEWLRETGLPFVFALFLVRRGVPREEVLRLHSGLKSSLKDFFSEVKSGKFSALSHCDIEYLSTCIDYSLTQKHAQSLERFFSFMEKETGKPAPKTISLFPL